MINYNDNSSIVYYNHFTIADRDIDNLVTKRIEGGYLNYINSGFSVLPIKIWFSNKTQYDLVQLHIQVLGTDLTNRFSLNQLQSALVLTETSNSGHSIIPFTQPYDLYWASTGAAPVGDLFHIYFAYTITKLF
tara:strand:- start:2962 stop:3360 length:399 start_codon:yes stop_codon:yes gene_type:complete